MSGSGIRWAICKSAPRSRQITKPAPHRSVFLQAGCPSCHPTNSAKALKAVHTHPFPMNVRLYAGTSFQHDELLLLSTSRIGRFHFQTGCHKRRLNLALVFVFSFFVVYFVTDACFLSGFFSFSVLSLEIGWEERLWNDLFCVRSGGV